MCVEAERRTQRIVHKSGDAREACGANRLCHFQRIAGAAATGGIFCQDAVFDEAENVAVRRVLGAFR